MLTVNEVTEIYYLNTEFSKEFDKTLQKFLLKDDNGKRTRDISLICYLTATL